MKSSVEVVTLGQKKVLFRSACFCFERMNKTKQKKEFCERLAGWAATNAAELLYEREQTRLQ